VVLYPLGSIRRIAHILGLVRALGRGPHDSRMSPDLPRGTG
jgi:hypothetical protein